MDPELVGDISESLQGFLIGFVVVSHDVWIDSKVRHTEGIIAERCVNSDSSKCRAVDAASGRPLTWWRKNLPEGRIYGAWNRHSSLIQPEEALWWRGGLRRRRGRTLAHFFPYLKRCKPVVSAVLF